MNKTMLATSIGQVHKIRPYIVQTLVEPGVVGGSRHRRYLDDSWFVTGCANNEVSLQNQRTGHVLPLPTEHIREYRRNSTGPGFLILKSQVFMEGDNIFIEPLL